MIRFVKQLRNFLCEEDGPSAVEYAVLLMLIFLAVIATVQSIGLNLLGSFDNSAQSIDTAVNGGS